VPAGDTMTIRGNGREAATAAPLQARRPLSIVLVRSASLFPSTAANASYDLPPTGLAYLAASLKKAGHRVRIIDAFGEQPGRLISHADGFTTKGLTAEEVAGRIPHDVDLIGVTCMFSNSWFYCRRTIAQIAATFPGVPIIAGGEHVTADHHRLLRRVPEVLCCVLGEGEETVLDVAAHLSHGLPLDTVPGIALRDASGAVFTTPDRHRILEVDEIPWPDWDTVPLTNYLDRHLSHDAYSSRTMPMVASRGCPYQCTFCSSPQMFGTKWVARNPRKVFEEIKHYYDTYGARYFEFHDLTMTVRREWILEFCKILIDEGLDIQWTMPSGTRSEALDAEVLGWMKRSGCRSFSYAAESGSVEELKRIKKRVNLPRMLASMREATKLGIVTRCHLIFGLPDQTKKDVLRTLGFITRVAWAGAHDVGCYVFSPYPGSEIYTRLVAEGHIDPEAADYDKVLAQNVFTNYARQCSWITNLPAWSIAWICLGMHCYFYAVQFLFRPQRLLALLQGLIRNEKHTYLQGFLIRKLGRDGSVGLTDGLSAVREV
jgi:anaerobic magnesium-protoporphyrin IX monomethyl ester cyclase